MQSMASGTSIIVAPVFEIHDDKKAPVQKNARNRDAGFAPAKHRMFSAMRLCILTRIMASLSKLVPMKSTFAQRK